LANGKFDSFTIQNMVNHLAQCPHYQGGVLHPAPAVMRVRDAAARVAQLVNNLGQLVQYPLWRYVDAAGQWICPFCLNHITSAVIRTEQDWPSAIQRMAWHIAAECSSYIPERPEPKMEALVSQAAAEPPDTPPRQPSHAVRTPVPTRSGGVQRLATPSVGNATTGTPAPTTALPVARVTTRVAMPGTSLTNRVSSGNTPASTNSSRSGVKIIPEVEHNDEPRVAMPISTRFTRKNGPVTPAPAEPAAADTSDDPFEQAANAATVKPSSTAQSDSDSNQSLMWMDDVEDVNKKASQDTANRLDTERVKARAVQKNLMADVPSIPGYSFATRFEACHDISGDFYEFMELPDGRIGFAQGDVSGHGMHAGLIMSMAKKTLEIFAQAGKGPAETLSKVNDALVDDLGGTIFISMTYAILDPGMGSITWARAGHSPAVHYNLHSGEIAEIKGKGMVVGMKKGELFRKSLEEVVTPVRTGDIFLVYTDGVTETMNRQQEEYGLDLLFEVVRKHAGSGPDVLLDRIMDSIRQFRGGSTADDDTTLLAMAVD
jgi:hypothetical protein